MKEKSFNNLELRFQQFKFLCEHYIPGQKQNKKVKGLLDELRLQEDPTNPFALQNKILVEFDRIQMEYKDYLQ